MFKIKDKRLHVVHKQSQLCLKQVLQEEQRDLDRWIDVKRKQIKQKFKQRRLGIKDTTDSLSRMMETTEPDLDYYDPVTHAIDNEKLCSDKIKED